MLFTVSTVKDTLPHLQRFVAGNLAGGVDHLVVILDDPTAPDQAEPRAFLEAHPHVTCLLAGERWWAGDRPAQLNVRQRVHANLIKSVLADVPDAEWLFHVDADEIVQLDREVVAGIPDDVVGIQLAPWETVSKRRWDGDPDLFKHLLDDDDLALLHTLGVVEEPSNVDYFHGHISGKPGVRPGATAWLTLHHVVDQQRENLPVHEDDRLRVLHYESYSGEEFVRKWLAMLGSGPKVSFRRSRGDTAAALQTLVAKDLAPEVAEGFLLRLFDTTTADDEQTLLDLGLVQRLDPTASGHRPADPSGETAAALAAGLSSIADVPKRRFHSGRTEAEHAARGASGVGPAAEERASGVRRLLRRQGRA